jgi:hypothetical protein
MATVQAERGWTSIGHQVVNPTLRLPIVTNEVTKGMVPFIGDHVKSRYEERGGAEFAPPGDRPHEHWWDAVTGWHPNQNKAGIAVHDWDSGG